MNIVFDSNDFHPKAKEHGKNCDALIAAIDAHQVSTIIFKQPNAQQG
jgi:hypothetical protein